MIDKLANEGVRSFRIDGSQMNYKEYKKIISQINRIFSDKEEIANILFNLKGPTPVITKIKNTREENFLKIKKGQKIRIKYHTTIKSEEKDFLYIDKKISHALKIGDILQIGQSDFGFKVVNFDKNKQENRFSIHTHMRKIQSLGYNLTNNISLFNCYDNNINKEKTNKLKNQEKEFNKLYAEAESSNGIFTDLMHNDNVQPVRRLSVIDEETTSTEQNKNILNKNNFKKNLAEDEEMLFDAVNFDNSFEEKIKQKHQKTTKAYQKIVTKHKTHKPIVKDEIEFANCVNPKNKNNNDLDKLSGISHLNISQFSDLDQYIYHYKKERIRSNSSLSNLQSSRNNKVIICEALEDSIIYTHNSINLLGRDIVKEADIPMLSAKDIIDLNKICQLGINIITVSVNSAENIDEIKELLTDETKSNLKIFARIETENALINFDSILNKCDGILIRHGLISPNLPFDEQCLVEMYMLEKCRIQNKTVILQTLAMKSMNISKPSISQISTIDFAVKEGIDSLLLIEDHNYVNYYFDIIRTVRDALLQIEAYEDNKNKYEEMSKFFKINKNEKITNSIDSLFDCAVKLAHEIKAEMIILSTDNPSFAKNLSNYRPPCIISYPNNNQDYTKYSRLMRGVLPFYHKKKELKNEELLKLLIETFINRNFIKKEISKIIVINAFVETNVKFKNSLFIVSPDMLEKNK